MTKEAIGVFTEKSRRGHCLVKLHEFASFWNRGNDKNFLESHWPCVQASRNRSCPLTLTRDDSCAILEVPIDCLGLATHVQTKLSYHSLAEQDTWTGSVCLFPPSCIGVDSLSATDQTLIRHVHCQCVWHFGKFGPCKILNLQLTSSSFARIILAGNRLFEMLFHLLVWSGLAETKAWHFLPEHFVGWPKLPCHRARCSFPVPTFHRTL